MKHFGTVKSYDAGSGLGVITPDEDDDGEVTFEKAAIRWDRVADPCIGQRLSYELVPDSRTRAVNLQTIWQGPWSTT